MVDLMDPFSIDFITTDVETGMKIVPSARLIG